MLLSTHRLLFHREFSFTLFPKLTMHDSLSCLTIKATNKFCGNLETIHVQLSSCVKSINAFSEELYLERTTLILASCLYLTLLNNNLLVARVIYTLELTLIQFSGEVSCCTLNIWEMDQWLAFPIEILQAISGFSSVSITYRTYSLLFVPLSIWNLSYLFKIFIIHFK
jgi:hypothetical protein